MTSTEVVQKLYRLGQKYPMLNQFAVPLAKSVETGIDPEGSKTDYLEVAGVIEGVVIKIAQNAGLNAAIPMLREIASDLNSITPNDGGSALGLAMKGEVLINQEKFDEAIDILSKAIETDPTVGGAMYNLGVACFKKVLKFELIGSRALTSQMAELERKTKYELLDKAEKCWKEVLIQEPQNKLATKALADLSNYRKQNN